MAGKIYAEIGKRIEENRKVLGFSQEYVAESLDISDRQYRRIEKGQVVIYMAAIGKLYELGFDVYYILFGKSSIDVYIEKALNTMPQDMIEKNAKRLGNIALKIHHENPDFSRLTPKEIQEANQILIDTVIYGQEHFSEANISEDEEFHMFTELFRERIPKRIKRRSSY